MPFARYGRKQRGGQASIDHIPQRKTRLNAGDSWQPRQLSFVDMLEIRNVAAEHDKLIIVAS